MEITNEHYGTLEDGTEVLEYTLKNDNGLSLSAVPFGATVTKVVTPDKNQNFQNITLQVESLEDMVEQRPFYGATIGRIAGRITSGSFFLDGKQIDVDKNEGANLLHGGSKGLDTVLWDVETSVNEDEASLTFTHTSPDGDNGFPGELKVRVVYTLNQDNQWIIDYQATTDKPTLFNPTNHIYFNLTGDIKKPILNHKFKMDSQFYGELNDETLPTGNLLKVDDTPFDFNEGKVLKETLLSDHEQIKPINGLDHPFVLNPKQQTDQAVLSDPESGRFVKMHTDQNSVVVFTHNIEVSDFDIQGEPAKVYAGMTLETQTLPDAINQPGFGNTILRPDETYSSRTTYSFGVEN